MQVENTTTGHKRILHFSGLPGDPAELVVSLTYKDDNEGSRVLKGIALDNTIIPAIIEGIQAQEVLQQLVLELEVIPNGLTTKTWEKAVKLSHRIAEVTATEPADQRALNRGLNYRLTPQSGSVNAFYVTINTISSVLREFPNEKFDIVKLV